MTSKLRFGAVYESDELVVGPASILRELGRDDLTGFSFVHEARNGVVHAPEQSPRTPAKPLRRFVVFLIANTSSAELIVSSRGPLVHACREGRGRR